jgi:hypothetical protein
MSCKLSWDRKFLINNFEKSFMNKIYKEYRENLLFEKELSLLPMTQPHVEKIMAKNKLKNEVKDITIKMYGQAIYEDINKYKYKIEDIIFMFYDQIDLFQNYYIHMQERLVIINDSLNKLKNNDGKETEKNKFIRQCPNNECRGFLSSSLKCNLCEMWACSECHEMKGNSRNSEHICNKEILESIKMMEKDTKACPKCAALIFKTDGCDQIFCVECHTAFSWKTLKIDTGDIHNPHYFELLAKNNGSIERNPRDIICGRDIDNNFLMDLFREMKYQVVYTLQDQINKICMNIIHIKSIEIPKFTRNNIQDNMDIRIEYMMNEITKKKFKSILQRREKKNQKDTEILNVLTTFVNCTTEIMYRYYEQLTYQETNYDTVTPKIYNEFVNLTVYINECFISISNTYNCKQYQMNLNKEFYIFS